MLPPSSSSKLEVASRNPASTSSDRLQKAKEELQTTTKERDEIQNKFNKVEDVYHNQEELESYLMNELLAMLSTEPEKKDTLLEILSEESKCVCSPLGMFTVNT